MATPDDDNTPDMPMTAVSSTNVAKIGTEGRDLLVQFLSGDTYRFIGKAEHAGEILTSDSPGGYINRHFGRTGIKE